jgi:hypothetical protein
MPHLVFKCKQKKEYQITKKNNVNEAHIIQGFDAT